MKLAAVIHSLQGGGAERVMAKLVSRLADRGHQVTLITLDDGNAGSASHQVDGSVNRVYLDVMRDSKTLFDRLINTKRRLTAIRSAVHDVDPDVVLSFCDQTNISVLAATKRLGIPIVIAERSDPSQQHLGRMWEWARRRTYCRAAKTIALTKTAAEYLRPLCVHGVVVIPSATDVPPVTSDRGVAAFTQRIVAVGRLAREKGFDRLIDAFAKVTSPSDGWTLVIFGVGSQRAALTQQIERERLLDRVLLPGWVHPLWNELATATFFVLPSRYEGFPSALLEAMSVGVPALSVDCESGPRAIVNHNVDGLLVENSTAAIADGMITMIRDESLRERLGVAGREVTGRFGWDAMVDAYEHELLAAASKNRKA